MTSSDTLCAKCQHPQSEHRDTLFGVECCGRFWADEPFWKCGCTMFVPAEVEVEVAS